MHWITTVYIISALIVYAEEVYREYRRGMLFLDDLLKPLLPALCPVINTLVAASHVWSFVVDKSGDVLIWKRRN